MLSFYKGTNIVSKNLKKGFRITSLRLSPQANLNSSNYCSHKVQFQNSKQKKDITYLITFTKRRVPFFPSFAGSITIETAFVLPLFMFFCIQIISFICLVQLHSCLEAALHQESCQLALQSYVYEQLGKNQSENEQEKNEIKQFLLQKAEGEIFKNKVIERAGKEYLNHSLISGGSRGICCQTFEVLADRKETIDVSIIYRVHPMFELLGFGKFYMGNRCKIKAWTGYPLGDTSEMAGNNKDEDEIVYITETGTAYHKDRNCTHLNLAISMVSCESINGLRNEDGGKYYPCEFCGSKKENTCYIAAQGNRFHTKIDCSGLKRTIYAVKQSEVGGRTACTRCYGS